VAPARRPRALPVRPAREATLTAGLLPRLIGYQLRLAQVAVFRDFERTVGVLGISPGRVGVMLLIEANPGMAQSRLAEAVELDRSTLVPVIDQLEAAGRVERRPGPDRRTNGLWLTAAGRRFLARVKARIRAHEARIGARLSAAERAELLRLLGLLQAPAGQA